jgi:hypothetical protein
MKHSVVHFIAIFKMERHILKYSDMLCRRLATSGRQMAVTQIMRLPSVKKVRSMLLVL